MCLTEDAGKYTRVHVAGDLLQGGVCSTTRGSPESGH